MQARERLYLTADKNRVVREGDPKAAFLYAALGDEIPASAADRFSLVDGKLKVKGAKPEDPATPKPQEPATPKPQEPGTPKPQDPPAAKPAAKKASRKKAPAKSRG